MSDELKMMAYRTFCQALGVALPTIPLVAGQLDWETILIAILSAAATTAVAVVQYKFRKGDPKGFIRPSPQVGDGERP